MYDESMWRIIVMRRLDKLGIPSHCLRKIGARYAVYIPNTDYTLAFRAMLNPFAIERTLKKYV